MSEQAQAALQPFAQALAGTVAEMARRTLGLRQDGAAADLGRQVAGLFEAAAAGLGQLLVSERPAVCGPGCSWCCHPLVMVDAPAVLLLAAWIAPWPAERVQGIRRKIAAYRADGYALTTVPRPPCPLLEDGKCSVYEVRPLVCRAHNSIDVAPCRRRYEGLDAVIEGEPAPIAVRAAIEAGLAEAMTAMGLGHGLGLDLAAALGIALEQPDAARRWLAGEDVFAAARLPESIRRLALDGAAGDG